MKRSFAALLMTATSILPLAHAGSDYPTKQLKLVVPYPAGGSTDAIGRIIANSLSKELGQTVVVDNRSGANGNIGAELVSRSVPDGYTFLIGGSANAINMSLYKSFPNDLTKDLKTVAIIGVLPNMMVVTNSVPAKDVQSFIQWAKAQPHGINYASSGTGATTHLTAELFKMVTGTPMNHIPYRGSSPALMDLIAGRTVVMFDNMTSALQQVKTGQIRALALAGKDRNPALPDVPTLKESGVDLEVEPWFGLFMPAATPKAILGKMNTAVGKIVMQPEIREQLKEFGLETRYLSLPSLQLFVDNDVRRWASVIESAGVKVE